MGRNWHGVKFLAHVRRGGVDFSRTVTIGRQNLHISMPHVRQILNGYGLPHALKDRDVLADPEFAEPIFKLLGAQTVDSLDASEYEHATIIADLNKPVPQQHHNSYDVVYDGGSSEHVFNVEQVLKNLMSLPKVGGSLIIHTMANNCFGHGLYQFSPELFFRVFAPENGYRVECVVIHADFPYAQWYDVPDPADVGSRIELANNRDSVMLFVHAIRTAIVPILEKPPQQSDYSALWEARSAPDLQLSPSAQPTGPSLKERIVGPLKEKFPWAVRMKHELFWAVPTFPRLLNGIRHRRGRERFSIRAQPTKFRPVK